MRRLHLFEVLDQAWCPAGLRDALTEYLQFTIKLNNPYRSIVPQLAAALQATRAQTIVDLCAGAGGPWLQLHPVLEMQLARPLNLLLTDRFPHQASQPAGDGSTSHSMVLRAAADARAVPASGEVFRTIFAGFHHFQPHDAQAILRDALQQRQGIAIFEVTQRRLLPMLTILLSALSTLLTTPFIRPWRGSRFFWTYLLPLLPLVVLFDGVVSCLRSYTLDELHELIGQVDDHTYHWEVGEAPVTGTPLSVTYVIGYPRSNYQASKQS